MTTEPRSGASRTTADLGLGRHLGTPGWKSELEVGLQSAADVGRSWLAATGSQEMEAD